MIEQALTLIIPTAGRLDLLRRTLDSIQLCPHRDVLDSVLVIDNTPTGRVTQAFSAQVASYGFPLRIVPEPRPGLHEGRHRGLAEARTEWIAYLDDDVELAPTYFRGARTIMASHCAAGTGPIRPVWAVEPPAWLRRAAAGDTYSFLSLLDLGRGTFQIRPERVYGANLIIRRSVVIALGGFHPDGYPPELELMRGDGETGLMRKLAESGYTTMYAGDMGVGHVIPVKRMELSALRKRAYIGAISQSFHDLRAAAGLYKPSRIATENARIARIREKVGSRLPWNGGIALVLRTQAARKATPLWLQRELQSEAMRGYEAHQQRFHTDAEFRVHVLRDTWLEPEHLTSRG